MQRFACRFIQTGNFCVVAATKCFCGFATLSGRHRYALHCARVQRSENQVLVLCVFHEVHPKYQHKLNISEFEMTNGFLEIISYGGKMMIPDLGFRQMRCMGIFFSVFWQISKHPAYQSPSSTLLSLDRLHRKVTSYTFHVNVGGELAMRF